LFDIIEPYSVTDMKRGRIINIAWECRDYAIADIAQLTGEHFIDNWGYMEFIPDQPALEQLVLDTFYTPQINE